MQWKLSFHSTLIRKNTLLVIIILELFWVWITSSDVSEVLNYAIFIKYKDINKKILVLSWLFQDFFLTSICTLLTFLFLWITQTFLFLFWGFKIYCEGDDIWIAVNCVISILAILHKLNNSVTDRQSLTSLFHGTYL